MPVGLAAGEAQTVPCAVVAGLLSSTWPPHAVTLTPPRTAAQAVLLRCWPQRLAVLVARVIHCCPLLLSQTQHCMRMVTPLSTRQKQPRHTVALMQPPAVLQLEQQQSAQPADCC